MAEIELTQGYIAIVDDEDFGQVSQFKWYAVKSKRHRLVYAARSYWSNVGGKRKMNRIYLHQFINGKADGLFVDHKNGNGLDNRKCNLRFCTRSQNMANRRSLPGSTGVPNVQQIGESRFRVRFSIENTKRCFGCYGTIEEAKQVAELTAIRLRGAFHRAA